MYSEEETELRDLIMQNLENCGFLSKIKAEIRAGVFLALEEDGNFKNKVPLFNKKFDDFAHTSEGKVIISLIREFLDFYSLHFTLSIFEPEVAVQTPFFSHSELCDQLNVTSSENDVPILVTLLKEAVKARSTFLTRSSPDGFNSSPKVVKTTMNDSTLDKTIVDHLNDENINHIKDKQNISKNDSTVKESNDDLKNSFDASTKLLVEDSKTKITSDFLKEKNDSPEKSDKNNSYKKSSDLLSVEHDPFFDEPLPTEKTFFKISETSKDKSETMELTNSSKDFDDLKKSSLTSLRDLPSLTANHEWTYSRDLKNTLPSLDSLKSVSSSEASNAEIINLDPNENIDKKDSNITESNEESSERQNSEESIEEDLEDEFSNNCDDLLNSSLSLADDVTTDQTISQVSIVEGVDHVEPCK